MVPGALVRLPEQPGVWRVAEWEWRSDGVELALHRVGRRQSGTGAGDPGRASTPADAVAGPTALAAFELPWDGVGTGDAPALYAACSGAPGWTGAALFAQDDAGALTPLGPAQRTRARVGLALSTLGPADPFTLDRTNALDIDLGDTGLDLTETTVRGLAQGLNRLLVGDEIVQFALAEPLGSTGHWRLSHLLRGRGGTEAAIAAHGAGERIALLDDALTPLDPALAGPATTAIAALGVGDGEAAVAPIACRGLTARPLFPVHPRAEQGADGAMTLRWTRRARAAWLWSDAVDAPLHEKAEAYEVVLGDPDRPSGVWMVAEPELILTAAEMASLHAAHAGEPLSVRQRGSYAVSLPTRLTTLG